MTVGAIDAEVAIVAAVENGWLPAELADRLDRNHVLGAVVALRAANPGYEAADVAPLVAWETLPYADEPIEAYRARSRPDAPLE